MGCILLLLLFVAGIILAPVFALSSWIQGLFNALMHVVQILALPLSALVGIAFLIIIFSAQKPDPEEAKRIARLARHKNLDDAKIRKGAQARDKTMG
jgi:SNF family Na+-dependent transporter